MIAFQKKKNLVTSDGLFIINVFGIVTIGIIYNSKKPIYFYMADKLFLHTILIMFVFLKY